MDAFTPAQTTELISRIGAKKARMRIDKLFVNGFMGGCLICFGGALTLSTNAAPWFQTNAPGLIRSISSMFFPIGLIMIVLTGADLYTSYCMYSMIAFLHRRCSLFDALKTLVVSFFGNLAGALFFTVVLVGYGGIFETGAYLEEALTFVKGKAVTPEWHQIFLRAIICNWLVCMSVFLATSSREIISKIAAIWFPIFCFVGIAGDHVVANMFYIPLGIFLKAPAPLTVGYYIWKSMIPALLGNFIGGGIFCGAVYWYLFLHGQEVEIHFDMTPQDIAVYEQGGPLEPQMTQGGAGTGYKSSGSNGSDMKEGQPQTIPHSGNRGISGLAKDLHAKHFKKSTTTGEVQA